MIDQKTISQLMQDRGFRKIASINHEIQMTQWWSASDLLEISIVESTPMLLRCSKAYYMKSYTEEGETYIRDLNALQESLESYFPEVHISFSFFRDITQSLALRRIQERRYRNIGDNSPDLKKNGETLTKLKNQIERKKEEISRNESFKAISGKDSSILNTHLTKQSIKLKQELRNILNQGRQTERGLVHAQCLLKQYMNKGCAACMIFRYCSNIQKVSNIYELQDALSSITKEVIDAHKYQISQKLSGGKLNVFVEEVKYPALAWQIMGCGGAFNPRQLEKMSPYIEDIRKQTEENLMITPSKNIVVGGIIKDPQKLLPAKIFQNFINRLDKKPVSETILKKVPDKGGWIGNVIQGKEVSNIPFFHPINLKNGYISGTTRAGKSYLARVLVENALIEGNKDLSVVILDPTRQWSGLAIPTSSKESIKRLERLGISKNNITGFNTRTYCPGNSSGLPLPHDSREILKGCSVISMKGLDDKQRCQIARDILKTIYETPLSESEDLNLLLVLEEAHSFLPYSVIGDAVDDAKEVQILLNRISREKVKYGSNLLLITQSLSDFKRGGRIIREMTNTRFFLRATDQAEIEFVESYGSKKAGEVVKNLQSGEVLVLSPMVPTTKVFIRAPFSEVRELNDKEIMEINQKHLSGSISDQTWEIDKDYSSAIKILSEDEKQALGLIKEYYRIYGKPIEATELGNRLNLAGGARQRLIDGLKNKGLIQTITLQRQGRGRPPQGIIPLE